MEKARNTLDNRELYSYFSSEDRPRKILVYFSKYKFVLLSYEVPKLGEHKILLPIEIAPIDSNDLKSKLESALLRCRNVVENKISRVERELSKKSLFAACRVRSYKQLHETFKSIALDIYDDTVEVGLLDVPDILRYQFKTQYTCSLHVEHVSSIILQLQPDFWLGEKVYIINQTFSSSL